jgi:hypothetical protein
MQNEGYEPETVHREILPAAGQFAAIKKLTITYTADNLRVQKMV